MTLVLSLWLFFTSSGLILTAVYIASNLLLVVGASLVLLPGLHVGLAMGLRSYAYTASLFLFHLIITMLAIYIYLNRDLVIPTKEFVFSTFTDENLRTALIVLTATLMSILLPWLLIVRRKASILKYSPKKAVSELVGLLDFLKKGWIHAILLVSLLLAVFLIYTNTTILEESYPFNRRTHWIPGELLRIPTILAAIGIIASYFKYVHYGVRYYFTLNMARLNFVITLVLMLLLTGSRGYFVFLWLFVWIFESYLILKRRGSLFWCIIFIALSYFAYQSWPYLRWNLSLIPVKAALAESINIALFRSVETDRNIIYGSGIQVQGFTMIGASLFHLLYVIQLLKDGISLGGSTFINLVPQALPSFLGGILWDRPLNDNWRLAEYYHHGGGLLAVANAYWNGGLAVMVGFVSVLSVLFIGFDKYLTRPRTGVLYKFAYWLLIPVMITQLGYGIQGLTRVIEILAVIILIDILIDKINWRKQL